MPAKSTAAAPTEAEKAARKAEKAAKFKDLGAKRVSAALDKIALLSNLANRNSYEYTQEDVDKMSKALHAAVQRVEDNFKAALGGKKASTGGFEF
jgi:hypothetical protein